MLPFTPATSFKSPAVLQGGPQTASPKASAAKSGAAAATPLTVMSNAVAVGAMTAASQHSASANGIQAKAITGSNDPNSKTAVMNGKEQASKATHPNSQSDTDLADFVLENDYEDMLLTIDAIMTTCAMALKLPPPNSKGDINEMYKMVFAVMQQGIENQKTIEKAEQAISSQRGQINAMMVKIGWEKELANLTAKGLARQQDEYNQLMQTKSKMQAVFKEIEKKLICPSCESIALLPKVLGCGHVVCENCLMQRDLESLPIPASAMVAVSASEHIKAGRCPCCKLGFVGFGFPVFPLKSTAEIMHKAGFIKISQVTIKNSTHNRVITYAPRTEEVTKFEALHLGYKSHEQLARQSAERLFAYVSHKQWLHGVNIIFEAACSHTFFNCFAATLRSAGVDVTANPAKGLLTCCLVEKFYDFKTAERKILEVQDSTMFSLTSFEKSAATLANDELLKAIIAKHKETLRLIETFKILRVRLEQPKPEEINAAVQKVIAAEKAALEPASPNTNLSFKVASDGLYFALTTSPGAVPIQPPAADKPSAATPTTPSS